MTVEQANKQFPNYTWVLAKLPDGKIDDHGKFFYATFIKK